MKVKKILIPTDFSKSAHNAFKFAVEIAKRSGSQIHLVHVIEQPGVNSWTISDGDVQLPQNIASNIFFIKLVKKVKSDFHNFSTSIDTAGVEIKTHLRMGKPFQNIAEVIHSNNPELIIMGSNGEDEFIDAIIGSNAEKMIRKSSCPVIVVKEDIDINELNDVVLASEFDDKMKGLVLFLKELQKLLVFKLHLVLVSTPTNFESTHNGLDRIENFAKKHDIQNYESHIYSDFTEEEGIISYAESIGANLISMATNSHSPFVQFFASSISKEVVNTARKAVLTLKIDD